MNEINELKKIKDKSFIARHLIRMGEEFTAKFLENLEQDTEAAVQSARGEALNEAIEIAKNQYNRSGIIHVMLENLRDTPAASAEQEDADWRDERDTRESVRPQ